MSSITKTLTGGGFHQQNINGATADVHNSHFQELKFNETKTTSSPLQFFVRMMWKCNTLVIHASREDTVESILQQISSKAKIPIEYQRLIYNGKQLQQQQSLGECGIENDANLQLVGQLRSVCRSKAWKATDDIVSLILKLCRGESDIGASIIICKHFTKYMNNSFYVFKCMKIPSLLVALYKSPYASNASIADLSIRNFVKVCLELKCKDLQGFYLEVLLEFCELLRGVGCKCDHPLYVCCRDGFAELLTLVGGVPITNPKMKLLLRGVLDCVCEIADGLLRFLDLSMNCPTSRGLSYKVVLDFVKLCCPLRMGFAKEQATSDESLNCDICYEEDPLFSGVPDQLHIVFIKLLSKMDKCLQVMEDCLVNKKRGKGEWDVIHICYLIILKELFRISKFYSGAQEQFWGLFLGRKNVLPHMIVRYVRKTDDHRWLLENKLVTDFESRRHLAMMLFPDLKDEILGYEILIDRSQVLAESFEYISRAMPKSLQGDLFMAFKNEKATGPGVLREWFVLVCQEIFNPKNALFVACPNDYRRFFPNTASMVNALHLKYFIFSGRIIALALKKKVHVGIVFDRVFFKQLAGNYIITLEDIQDADPIMYSSCKQILEMDADYIDSDALGLTFSIEVEELGHREVIELCPGGESLVVDSKNREKYVHLLIQSRFVTSISKQISHFAQGFADIISGSSLEFFQFLDLEDFDWMLHGSENDINVEDWKAHTKYCGYKENDRQISWFWEIVGRMPAKQKKVLLFFWTSVKHLPVEGFLGLSSRLLICKSREPDNHLPSSHTCFYELCFPPYSSMAIMQDRLGIITQEHISCSFGTR